MGMRELLEYLSPCECCGNGCDCGCVLDCPRHKASADVEIRRQG